MEGAVFPSPNLRGLSITAARTLTMPVVPLSPHSPSACAQACSDPGKTLTVQVIDNCDECAANQVNLQAAPFAKLASPDIGRVAIEYKEVRALENISLEGPSGSAVQCNFMTDWPLVLISERI